MKNEAALGELRTIETRTSTRRALSDAVSHCASATPKLEHVPISRSGSDDSNLRLQAAFLHPKARDLD